jgi:hypothetical protein
MKIVTTTENGTQVHHITTDPAKNEYFKIDCGHNVRLTLDTSFNQVYFQLREKVEPQATIDVAEELELEGVLVLTIDHDQNSFQITGVEIIPLG